MIERHLIIDIVVVLGFLVAGAFVGYLLRARKKKVLRYADKLMMWTIYLFLFILGLSVGINEEIVRNLGTLGIKALILTLGALVGSAVAAFILYTFWFKEKAHEE